MSEAFSQIVLVVEDEPLILEMLQTTLEDAGFQTILALDDDEAFAALESDRARDLAGLVTDVNLRCARTGWAIAKRARELNPGLPVVYMSGDSGHDWTSQGVPHSTLVEKPFAPAQIVVALASLANKTDTDA
jgi:CheY-like chemotaxis protein